MGLANNVVTFGTITAPPQKPPNIFSSALGLYCIKATCQLRSTKDEHIAKYTGYDTSVNIAKKVEEACNFRRSALKREKCTAAEVTFIQRSREQPCSGEVYFEMDNVFRKLT